MFVPRLRWVPVELQSPRWCPAKLCCWRSRDCPAALEKPRRNHPRRSQTSHVFRKVLKAVKAYGFATCTKKNSALPSFAYGHPKSMFICSSFSLTMTPQKPGYLLMEQWSPLIKGLDYTMAMESDIFYNPLHIHWETKSSPRKIYHQWQV